MRVYGIDRFDTTNATLEVRSPLFSTIGNCRSCSHPEADSNHPALDEAKSGVEQESSRPLCRTGRSSERFGAVDLAPIVIRSPVIPRWVKRNQTLHLDNAFQRFIGIASIHLMDPSGTNDRTLSIALATNGCTGPIHTRRSITVSSKPRTPTTATGPAHSKPIAVTKSLAFSIVSIALPSTTSSKR